MAWLRKHLEQADADLLRELVATLIAALMGAEAEALCGAGLGERSPERVNRRNCIGRGAWTLASAPWSWRSPKLRVGSCFPDWLLEPRRRAERALIAVVAECYVRGVSTRRVEGLVQTLEIEGLSNSQVSELAQGLDAEVTALRSDRWTPDPTPMCGWMRSASGAGKPAAS